MIEQRRGEHGRDGRLAAADAIVVLGCPPRRGGIAGEALRRRADLGVSLWREGRAKLMVLSGGGEAARPEAEILRSLALAAGVDDDALVVEPRSGDTLANAREVAGLLRRRRLSSVILVSDRVHLPRAMLLFRLAGVVVIEAAGSRPASRRAELRLLLREVAALPWSLARAIVDRLRRRP